MKPMPGTPSLLALGLCLGGATPASAETPALADFGHQSLRVNGQPALGQRRCLIVLIDVTNDANAVFAFHPAQYFANLVFNPLAPRDITFANPPLPGSVNGFLAENSGGRFAITRAVGAAHPDGFFGPLLLTAAERALITGGQDEAAEAKAALAAATRAGLVLADFDADGNGWVGAHELLLLVVVDNPGDNGKARGVDFRPEGSSVRFAGSYCAVTQQASFATLMHEMSHLLGTLDLYYGNPGGRPPDPRYYRGQSLVLNTATTLMGPTITVADNPAIYHLDPWHKLVFGWNEPRIVSMRTGGSFSLPAARTARADGPILLYDPWRGTNEFFLIEYRTRSRNRGAGGDSYDSNVAGQGLFLWHVQQAADHKLEIVDSPFDLTTDTNGLVVVDLPFGNWVEGPPNPAVGNAPTPNGFWTGGQTTFRLRWNDAPTWAGRSSSPAQIRVHPFTSFDDEVFIEVLTDAEIWVDFDYPGQPTSPETGDVSFPFNSLAEGVAQVGLGGRLSFKPGAQNPAPITLSKPMTLQAPLGPVRLGP